MEALTRAIEGITARGGIAIVIAHRPSALVAVDLVAIVQNGRMVSFGKKQDIISIDAENTDSIVSAESPTMPVLRIPNATPTAPAAAAPAAPINDANLKDRRLIVLFFDLSSMQDEEIERAAKPRVAGLLRLLRGDGDFAG